MKHYSSLSPIRCNSLLGNINGLPSLLRVLHTSVRDFPHCSMFLVLPRHRALLYFVYHEKQENPVGLTLNLNMLVVVAVFAFVAAILLGAF
jgi:hypothetical protein